MLGGRCVTRLWRHGAIFGSGVNSCRKLSRQALWHLVLASGECHCGQVQADLTDSGSQNSLEGQFSGFKGTVLSELHQVREAPGVGLTSAGANEGMHVSHSHTSGSSEFTDTRFPAVTVST